MGAYLRIHLTGCLVLLLGAGVAVAAEVVPADEDSESAGESPVMTAPPEPAADGDVDPDIEARIVIQTLREEPEPATDPAFKTLPELESPARVFLDSYFSYSMLVEARGRKELARSVERSESFLDELVTSGKDATYNLVSPKTRRARQAPEAVQAREAWTAAYQTYRSAAKTRLSTMPIDPARTMVVVVKSDYVAYLVDLDHELSLYYFPIAYGVNPYGSKKLRFGDCRTPSTENARITNISPISDKGMIGMWMGITVGNPDRPGSFWSRGDMVGLHGTPIRASVGMKASHGCIRMFEEDSWLLSRYVREGTRVVIWP